MNATQTTDRDPVSHIGSLFQGETEVLRFLGYTGAETYDPSTGKLVVPEPSLHFHLCVPFCPDQQAEFRFAEGEEPVKFAWDYAQYAHGLIGWANPDRFRLVIQEETALVQFTFLISRSSFCVNMSQNEALDNPLSLSGAWKVQGIGGDFTLWGINREFYPVRTL